MGKPSNVSGKQARQRVLPGNIGGRERGVARRKGFRFKVKKVGTGGTGGNRDRIVNRGANQQPAQTQSRGSRSGVSGNAFATGGSRTRTGIRISLS